MSVIKGLGGLSGIGYEEWGKLVQFITYRDSPSYRSLARDRQIRFQFERKAMPKNAQTTTQLLSSHMLAK